MEINSNLRWTATQTRLSYRPPLYRNDEPLEEIDVGPPFDWKPIIMTLLLGTRDMHSPLAFLQGKEEDIFQLVFEMLIYKYKEGAVAITPPAYSAARVEYIQRYDPPPDESDEQEMVQASRGGFGNSLLHATNALIPERYQMQRIGPSKNDRPQIAFSPCCSIKFPEPTGININMMPFIRGEKESLPKELWPYYELIISKCPTDDSEQGDVMYLTVQESYIEAGKTQRRPGLHIEAPASGCQRGEFAAALEHRWGFGMAYSADELHGGLYIATSTSNTTAVWDALVDSKLGAVDTYGGMDHLRPYIGRGKKIPANLLVWLTDRTPHEALPQEEGGYRQFFRLVTSDITVWYAAHSTLNPRVPVPTHVKIIDESKFSDRETADNVPQEWSCASDSADS